MRTLLLPAIILVAVTGTPALAQTTNQQHQPGLSSDRQKAQQNSADEAAIRGRMEDGIKPPDAGQQQEAGKKLEDAAGDAKQKSDAKTGSTGSATGATVPNPGSKPR